MIQGILGAQMADSAERERTSERHGGGFSFDVLDSVVGYGVSGKRTGRIKENIICARILRRIEPERKLVVRSQREIEFGESRGAEKCGRVEPGFFGEVCCGGEDERLIIGFVISRREWACASLRYHSV